MPPPNGKKKKKGHAPAHQNTFAFKHNAKSKKTAKILESPNIHVCRRCHEKIEWRKQYRKYKPRTQPGKCNGCQKRNVLAAYHTICEKCTRTSAKAIELIQAGQAEHQQQQNEGEEVDPEDMPEFRACAVCVAEVALPDPEVDDEEDILNSLGRLKLRERRAIERQLAKEAQGEINRESSDAEEEELHGDDGPEKQIPPRDTSVEKDGESVHNDVQDEEDDPFLKAVGGAGNLLTGEAYQQKLLQQQQSS